MFVTLSKIDRHGNDLGQLELLADTVTSMEDGPRIDQTLLTLKDKRTFLVRGARVTVRAKLQEAS